MNTPNTAHEFKTAQENFWAGEFGNAYLKRNTGDSLIASNLSMFASALKRTSNISTYIEFGGNIGLNLKALKMLLPKAEQHAIEINANAARELEKILPASNIYHTSILEFTTQQQWDLVLIKGVLIHINPDCLPDVYEKLYSASSKYILICEYYNPTPVSVNYRGHEERLFKRDFCGEMMVSYPDLLLLDYGFIYNRDPIFPQDDVTWFLLEKRS